MFEFHFTVYRAVLAHATLFFSYAFAFAYRRKAITTLFVTLHPARTAIAYTH